MSVFARNLRFLRKQRGVNQDEIALLFNKRPNTVGNWENSKSEPSIGELVKLADYFKVGLQDLLHSDLQKRAVRETQAGTVHPAREIGDANPYALEEAGASLAQDGSSDSFWLILRELRSLNEKIEDLKSLFETFSRVPGSDKSNH